MNKNYVKQKNMSQYIRQEKAMEKKSSSIKVGKKLNIDGAKKKQGRV